MMTSLRFALLAATGSLLTACPLAPSCGGFQGVGDLTYARANGDSAIACENGGFVAMFHGVAMEGRIADSSVTDGATGAFAFDFTHNTVNATSTTVGTDWTVVEQNEVTQDHADVLCQDLTTRTWWTAGTVEKLPVATAFGKPAEGYASVDDCKAANPDNPAAICEDLMLLCADGTAQLATAEGNDAGSYTDDAGELGVITAKWGISGTYTQGMLQTFALADGGTKVTWQTKPLAEIFSLSCQ